MENTNLKKPINFGVLKISYGNVKSQKNILIQLLISGSGVRVPDGAPDK
jgi:hypothetical protein